MTMPLDPDRLAVWVEPGEANAIRDRITNRLGAWGLSNNTKKLAGAGVKPLSWDRVVAGTLALFSNHDEYFMQARVIGTALSEQASAELWDSPKFPWLVFLSDIEPTSI